MQPCPNPPPPSLPAPVEGKSQGPRHLAMKQAKYQANFIIHTKPKNIKNIAFDSVFITWFPKLDFPSSGGHIGIPRVPHEYY
jgi:hypothetical protein